MKRLLFPLLCLLFCLSCSENSVEPKIFGEGNIYSVYETILTSVFQEESLTLVLNDSTGGMLIDDNSYNYFLEKMEGLTMEMINNYNEVNSSKIALLRMPNVNHEFVSEYTGEERGRVILTFSRVGFNNDNTKAIVLLGDYYAPLVGAGFLYFLEKTDDSWRIVSSIMVWIS